MSGSGILFYLGALAVLAVSVFAAVPFSVEVPAAGAAFLINILLMLYLLRRTEE